MFTGSVEGSVHFILLRVIARVEVHLVGGILGQLRMVIVVTAVVRVAWRVVGTIGSGGPVGVGGGLGAVDDCRVPGSVKSVFILVSRSRGLHKWRLGWPRRPRRSCGRRLVIILRVKIKQTAPKTAVV